MELTEAGHEFIEELMIKEGLLEEGDNLYGATNLNLLHHVHSGCALTHVSHATWSTLCRTARWC